MEITKAINRLAPTANFAVTGEDVNQIEWRSDDIERPSNEAILAEAEVIEVEIAAKAYQRDRTVNPEQGGYPSIGDQMDMMWHDKQDDTTTWEDAVQAVKDAHPKP